ncbi:MAG TPA: zinc ribbon domain-containing protein [candidate division WOR-3 bacterium]|uniref:Zinc ribbon domain-containing protein n=1 Tax=candidate division WOR-3 bacterium TaxID=2052148 RepID=A0A7V0T4G7_UNCW3|nr:zinc ribbon domain-containing protein [candidate division WOR-3 bacterium]
MPIREFRCRECRKTFEALVFSPRDEAGERCPSCGSGRLEKLFSVFGVSGTERKITSSANCASCSSRNCASCS